MVKRGKAFLATHGVGPSVPPICPVPVRVSSCETHSYETNEGLVMIRLLWSKAVIGAVCLLIGCSGGGSAAGPVQASRSGDSSVLQQEEQARRQSRNPDQLRISVP